MKPKPTITALAEKYRISASTLNRYRKRGYDIYDERSLRLSVSAQHRAPRSFDDEPRPGAAPPALPYADAVLPSGPELIAENFRLAVWLYQLRVGILLALDRATVTRLCAYLRQSGAPLQADWLEEAIARAAAASRPERRAARDHQSS